VSDTKKTTMTLTKKKVGILLLILVFAGAGFVFWKWKQKEDKATTEDAEFEEVEERNSKDSIVETILEETANPKMQMNETPTETPQ
jgi:type IV secretory pathway VirB10-like protein